MQSKVRPIENLSFLMISAIFEILLLWTAWSELSVWYQFSTQNLMPSKFHLMGLAKFRQLAILAVSGGYFSWLLWRTGLPDFGFHIFELPRTWAFQNGIPIVHWVFFLKWLRRHMWQLLIRIFSVFISPTLTFFKHSGSSALLYVHRDVYFCMSSYAGLVKAWKVCQGIKVFFSKYAGFVKVCRVCYGMKGLSRYERFVMVCRV